MRQKEAREAGSFARMTVVKSVSQRKGARDGVYVSPRRAVGVASQLGGRLRRGPRSPPRRQRRLSLGSDLSHGGGRPPGQSSLGLGDRRMGSAARSGDAGRAGLSGGAYPLSIDAAAAVSPPRR